jgi:integrase
MDRPLSRITPEMVLERHTAIHDGVADQPRTRLASSRTTANAWGKVLRALFNFERIPINPVHRLSEQRAWYRERPRTGRLTAETLPAWWREVLVLNATQRDYLLVVLLTGLRRNEVARLQWGDIGAGIVTVKAKGGHARAVPIGRWLGALLAERREVLNGTPYVFPVLGKPVTCMSPVRPCGVWPSHRGSRRSRPTISGVPSGASPPIASRTPWSRPCSGIRPAGT